jgi:nitrile hydratase accessory protein
MKPAAVDVAPAIPGDEGGPVFREPWQANAFALAVALNRKGVFGWGEWVETFAAALRDLPADPGESIEAAYYRRWLLALETLVAEKGLATSGELGQRKEDWRRAYLRTPHGHPVELEAGRVDASSNESDCDRHLDDRPATGPVPVAVSPATAPMR